ncbi:MAG: carboxypeptidase regulatory-like domain-containing protein [Ignavibacteria bacterium]|nr:carboxypeptidase regulatory-like domain-containing protein [Ignavibacteria bacterium]
MKNKLTPLLFTVMFLLFIPGLVLSQNVSPGISYYINTNNLYYPGDKVSVYLYAYSYSDKVKEKEYTFEISVLKIKDIEGFYSNQTSRGNINVIGKDSSNLLYYTDEIKSFSKKIKVKKDYGYLYLNENIPLNINENGAYVVKVSIGQYVAYTGFIISRYGILTEVGNNSVLLYAVDRKTGIPVDEAELNFFQKGKSRLKGKTRGGILYGEYIPEVDEKNSYDKDILVIGKYDDEIIISDPYSYYNYPSENYSVYIYTQQPVYRTGSLVNFKSVIKKRETSEFKSYAYREVNVKINDPYGQKVYETKLTTNQNGSINGSFEIPEDGKLGDYYIYVYLSENKAYSNSFTVEQYKKPEYKVTVNTDKKQYYGKDELQASVEAKYYFGSLVSEADVEYNIYKVRYYTPWWKFTDYAWWFEDEEDEYTGDFSGAVFIYSGKGKLNSEGKFEFDYAINEDFKFERNNGWWWYRDYYTDFRYIVQARVTDKSRREISGIKTVYVTRGGFYMNIKANKYFYTPEEKVNIKINAQDFFDKPTETNLKVEIYKTKWYKWTDREQKDLIKVLEGKTNKEGKANLEFFIDKENSDGYYEMKAIARDERGNEITSTAGFYVYTGEKWWWGYYGTGGTQIMLDKDSYKKGDTCKVFIATSDSNVNLLFSAKTDNILYYKTVMVPERNAYVEFILDDKFNTTFNITASYVKDMQINTATENIKIIPEEKFLTVELTPSKNIYKPKEEGEYTIRVVDFYGNPVSNAEVSLGVVDESIYAIKEDKTKDIRKFFYSANYPIIGTSFNYVSTNYGYSRLITIFERFNIKSAKESELGTINGVLYSKGNKPIANAVIVVDGIYYACTTGPDGEFEFKLPEGKYSVSVYTGKEEIEDVMEIKIRKGETKTIKLYTDEELNEIYNREMLDGMGEDEGIEEQTLAPRSEIAKEETGKKLYKNGKGKDDDEGKLVEPELRSDFKDAIIWMPYVTTDANGYAKVNVKYPDNLTEWRITARVITEDTRVGQVTGRVITRKDLLVRMETPRFLQSEDELVISTIVHNYLSTEKYTKVSFKSEGVELVGNNQVELNLKPNTDERIDWKIKVNNPTGEAKLYCEALTNEESDAVEIKVPIQPKGLEMFQNNITDITDEFKTESETINIPKYADLRTVNLKFTASSSIASALLTSLDDLAGYPYGCVEQTMSRFLPSVIVANAFKELNAPLSEKTKKELPNMVSQGINKLYGFQQSDGGWGWWTNDGSQPYMTAYVLYGLNIAKISGYNVSQTVINKGIAALKNHLNSDKEPVTKAYMLYVLSTLDEKNQSLIYNELSKLEKEELNDFALALTALAYHNTGKDIDAQQKIEALEKSVKYTGDDMAYWEGQKFKYRWQDDRVQTTAMILKAFVNVKKDSPLTGKIVRWLLMQRQGTSWRNTQETALTVFSMVDYLKISKELDPDFSVKIYVNNEFKFEKRYTKDNIYDKDSVIKIKGTDLKSGDNEVRIEKSGKGKLYFSSVTSYFDNTGKIDAAENWFRVEREYYRLEQYESYSGEKITYRKKYFSGEVKSGDIIFVKLRVFTREENLSYFMLEEPLPAGCEVVKDDWAYNIEDEKDYTGYTYYWWRWWYADKEVRDNRVTFFATYLYGNEFEFSYIMRAQIPGDYTVNPARAMLMYYPDINGNTAEIKMKITD